MYVVLFYSEFELSTMCAPRETAAANYGTRADIRPPFQKGGDRFQVGRVK
jgi:hypothetical protein